MIDLCSSLEAILFAAGEPVPIARISLVLNEEEDAILAAAEELNDVYGRYNHAMTVLKLGDKLQMCVTPEYNSVITKILEERKPQSLSQASLETLAIVAYYQPVTVAYIMKVRGVESSYTVSSLSEKGLIEVKGRLEAPGRPLLYGTTDLFLRTMGIQNIKDLPDLPDMAQSEGIERLQEAIDAICAAKDIQMAINEIGDDNGDSPESSSVNISSEE